MKSLKFTKRQLLNGVAVVFLGALLSVACDAKGDSKPRYRDAPKEEVRRESGESEEVAQAKRMIVARVGTVEITTGDLLDQLAEQEPVVSLRFASPERKRAYLREWVRIELLAAQARKEGLIQHPDVVRVAREALAAKMITELQREAVQTTQGNEQNDEAIRNFVRSLRDKTSIVIEEATIKAMTDDAS
jgi:hypothetical protein